MAGPLLQSHDPPSSPSRFDRFRAVHRAVLQSACRGCTFLGMLARGVRVYRAGAVEIGRGVQIGREVVLDARAGTITLEDAVVLAPGATLLTGDPKRGCPRGMRDAPNAQISIGRGARIGADAILLGGARIGAGAIVGVGAVVRGHVEDRSIVVGGPPPRRIGECVGADGALQFRGSSSDASSDMQNVDANAKTGPTLA